MSLLVHLVSLNTSTHLDSGTLVGGALVVRNIINLLEVMGPDTQSTSTGGLAIEVMAGVLDDQTEASVSGKVDRKLDLSNVGDVHSVAAVATDHAGCRSIGRGQTSAALEEGPHHRGRIGSARVNC